MGVGVVTDNLAGTRPTRGAQIQISKSSCSQVPSRFRTTGSTGQSQVWGPDSLLSPLLPNGNPCTRGIRPLDQGSIRTACLRLGTYLLLYRLDSFDRALASRSESKSMFAATSA